MLNKAGLAAAAWTVFITYACMASPATIPQASWLAIPYKDKIVHFLFYFVFAILWHAFFAGTKKITLTKCRLYAFLMALIFGILIEIAQGIFTSDRSPDILDALANTAGGLTATLLLWILGKKEK